MTPAASQRMMKMCAALWGSQSWLPPAFQPAPGHAGKRVRRQDCLPHSYFRGRLRLVHPRGSSDVDSGDFRAAAQHGGACFSLPSERSSDTHLPPPYAIDQPLRTVGTRYLLASTLLVIFIFAGSYSSLPSNRRAITPSSIHSTNGAATLKLEQAGSPPLQARIQSR